MHEPFDELLPVGRPVDVLLEDEPIFALLADAGPDLERIAEDRAFAERQLAFVDDESDARIAVERDEVFDAETVLACALEILEVVRVVHDPGVVGVLVVDLDRMNETARHRASLGFLVALSIALVVGCRGRSPSVDAGQRARDASTARTAGIPAAEWLATGLSGEPSGLSITDGPSAVIAVVDLVDERRVFSGGARSFPRSESDRLRFVVTLDGTPVSLSQDGDRLTATALDGSGRSVRVERVPAIATMRRATSGATLYFAHAGARPPVELETFELTGRGIVHRHRSLERETDELSRELVGLDADEAGYAVLYRRSVPEDHRGGVTLATERGTFSVDALHDLGLLESIERTGESIAIVGSFEFDRPIAFRLDPRGRLLATERLAPGTRSSFVSTSGRANLETDGPDVVVRVRDATGDAVREHRFTRLAGTTPPALCRDRHGFVVAWTDLRQDGWAIRLVHLGNEHR